MGGAASGICTAISTFIAAKCLFNLFWLYNTAEQTGFSGHADSDKSDNDTQVNHTLILVTVLAIPYGCFKARLHLSGGTPPPWIDFCNRGGSDDCDDDIRIKHALFSAVTENPPER